MRWLSKQTTVNEVFYRWRLRFGEMSLFSQDHTKDVSGDSYPHPEPGVSFVLCLSYFRLPEIFCDKWSHIQHGGHESALLRVPFSEPAAGGRADLEPNMLHLQARVLGP